MPQPKSSPTRKKKIRTILNRMTKQSERFLVVAPPLVDMMDLTTTDEELDFLLQLGTVMHTYKQLWSISGMPEKRFKPFFDTVRRKGLVYPVHKGDDIESYRLNAIVVGWYEVMMHYLVGKPEENKFSEKSDEYFRFGAKFNVAPLRNVQNAVFRHILKPTQDAGIMEPATQCKNKRKIIPINTVVAAPTTQVYPTSFINRIIEEFGDKNSIYVLPCVCRRGARNLGNSCDHEMPEESCIAFGGVAKELADWGYGRFVNKAEAMEILKVGRDKGAVHSVLHERDDHRLPVIAICNCCWDCCGILKSYNMGAVPLKYKSYFQARIKDESNCKGCNNCERYCPTTAMRVIDNKATLNSDKCIGCGQCAFQCRQNNIELIPNERIVYLPLLKKSEIRIQA